MHVVHAFFHNLPHLFQPFVISQCTHCIALHQHKAIRQQLNCFQSRSMRANQSLASFHKPFFVSHQISDLNHVTIHVIAQHFTRLCQWNRPRQQLDQIACFQNDVWIKRLVCCRDFHASFNQIQRWKNSMRFKKFRECWPDFTKVFLAICWKQCRKRGFFKKCSRRMLCFERIDLPMINAFVIPRLVFAIPPILTNHNGVFFCCHHYK
mmetsp:Transcript_9609/g.17323  ORF Transcript_9609/g.17323 Transcript_9609/m.17323 type:complete len:208 (-) Transcript_9609:6-629(-)